MRETRCVVVIIVLGNKKKKKANSLRFCIKYLSMKKPSIKYMIHFLSQETLFCQLVPVIILSVEAFSSVSQRGCGNIQIKLTALWSKYSKLAVKQVGVWDWIFICFVRFLLYAIMCLLPESVQLQPVSITLSTLCFCSKPNFKLCRTSCCLHLSVFPIHFSNLYNAHLIQGSWYVDLCVHSRGRLAFLMFCQRSVIGVRIKVPVISWRL